MVAEREANVTRQMVAQRSVLIVDDQEEIRDLLKDVLELHGYSPRSAANGRDALDEVRRQRPDLITLDLAMPVLDGHGVLTDLAKDPKTATIPVVVVSAYTTDLRPTPQVKRVVSKPFEVSELVDVIREVFFRAGA